jgi:hypothetical protein
MRRLVTLLAIALAALPGLACAAEPACLTPAEFTALSTFAMPSIINGTAARCAPSLPADAYLKRSGGQLAARYAQIRPAAWPSAKPAVLKLAASGSAQAADLIRSMPDANLQQMADAFIEGLVTQRVPAARCGAIDRLVRLLSPLPPENTAEVIALAVGLTSKAGRARFGNLSICQA